MKSESTRTLHQPTVLLVDDEPEFTASLAAMLEIRGYHAITASTGVEALRLVTAEQPDVALVDLRLPDQTGVELISRIRELSPATEAVVLTGHATVDSAASAMSLGAFAFLEKPCDNDRLLLTLEQALARRTGRTPAAMLADAVFRSPCPAGVIEAESGRLLAANSALVNLFGEVTGDPDLARLPVSDATCRTAVTDHLRELRAAGTAVTELALQPGRSRARWFELRSAMIPGWRDRAFAMLLDCDRQHQALLDGIRTRAVFEAIFDNLAAGIMVIDSLFVVHKANPAMARIIGTTTEALIGRRCYELLHHRVTPCGRHGETCPVAACLASGTPARVLYRHRDAAGHLRHIEVTVAPLHDDTGTTTSFVAMYTDLTELETAHAETRAQAARLAQLNHELASRQHECEAQAAELTAANARLKELSLAKDEFVSTVSHELRTPLTALSESLNLIAESADDLKSSANTALLRVAVRNCRRLAELINDLLDFSRIEAGRMQVNPGRLDVGALIREVCDAFAPAAKEKGLGLTATTPPELFANADERHVHRILCNLVANAVKFTQHGRIAVSAVRSESEIVISVADSGAGIPESDRGHIFERFYQCSHHGRNRPAGTGLGLALCRELVELNRGRIWFESTEGVGSTFHFALPAFPEDQHP